MWSLLGFKARYKKGQKIEANHPSGKFLPAVITEVIDNGQYYSVEFEGGEIASKVSGKFVREISTAPTVRVTDESSRTINSESSHLPPPRSPTRSPSMHMRKTASIGKLQKTASTRSSMSDKDGEGKKIGTTTQSRKNTMTFSLRNPLLSISTKGSTRSPVNLSTPTSVGYVDYTKPQSPMVLSAEPLEVATIPDLEDYVTPSTNKNIAQKPPKEKKERGKEEILLLSRIRRCKEESKYRSIDISRLNIERLPLPLMQINDLKELICQKNPLQSLDELIVFQQLERLDLSFINDIHSLSGWPRIFSEIPSTNMKILELNNVHLKEIPEEIRLFKRLEKLSLKNNQITVLPDWLVELRYLHTLDVTGNQINFLPPFLGQMKALTDLMTQNNPCQSLDLMTPEVAFLIDKRTIFMDKEQRKSLTHRAVKVNATIIERQKNQLVQQYIEEI